MPAAAAQDRRTSGPAQRGGRSQGMRGDAAQASPAHPPQWRMDDTA